MTTVFCITCFPFMWSKKATSCRKKALFWFPVFCLSVYQGEDEYLWALRNTLVIVDQEAEDSECRHAATFVCSSCPSEWSDHLKILTYIQGGSFLFMWPFSKRSSEIPHVCFSQIVTSVTLNPIKFTVTFRLVLKRLMWGRKRQRFSERREHSVVLSWGGGVEDQNLLSIVHLGIIVIGYSIVILVSGIWFLELHRWSESCQCLSRVKDMKIWPGSEGIRHFWCCMMYA